MSTILTQARTLRESVKRIANRESEAQVASGLASVSEALGEKVRQTTGLRESLAVMRAEKISANEKMPSAAQIASLQKF
jgi:hypothetical protein